MHSRRWFRDLAEAGEACCPFRPHYAVETSLGYRNGFFGLVAQGWDVEDTTGKGTRGALPAEALQVEQIVGLFDTERAAAIRWTADEFNGFSPRALTEAELQKVRAARSQLFERWFAVAPEGKLELTFD